MADTAKSGGGGCLIGIIFIIVAGVWIFNDGKDEIDKTGYLPHTHSVNLYMDENWLVGETRQCTAFENTDTGAGIQTLAIKTLQCPLGTRSDTPHNVEIKFFGRISRPDILKSGTIAFNWRCKREQDGFTCYALD